MDRPIATRRCAQGGWDIPQRGDRRSRSERHLRSHIALGRCALQADWLCHPPIPLAGLVPPGGIDVGCHIYDYFRVLSVLTSSNSPKNGRIPIIDWNAVLEIWTAPISVETLTPQRTTGGVRVENDAEVIADLYLGAETRKAVLAIGEPVVNGMQALVESPVLDFIEKAFNPEMTELRLMTSSANNPTK
jgi:hypothetical protein